MIRPSQMREQRLKTVKRTFPGRWPLPYGVFLRIKWGLARISVLLNVSAVRPGSCVFCAVTCPKYLELDLLHCRFSGVFVDKINVSSLFSASPFYSL